MGWAGLPLRSSLDSNPDCFNGAETEAREVWEATRWMKQHSWGWNLGLSRFQGLFDFVSAELASLRNGQDAFIHLVHEYVLSSSCGYCSSSLGTHLWTGKQVSLADQRPPEPIAGRRANLHLHGHAPWEDRTQSKRSREPSLACWRRGERQGRARGGWLERQPRGPGKFL